MKRYYHFCALAIMLFALAGCDGMAQVANAVGQGLNSPSWDNSASSTAWDNAAKDALPRAPICDVDPNCDQ